MAYIGLTINLVRKFYIVILVFIILGIVIPIASTKVSGETAPSPWLGGSQPSFGGLDNLVSSIPEKYGSTGNTNCVKQTITTKSAFKIFGGTVSPPIEYHDCAIETSYGSVSQQLLSRYGTSLYGKIYGLPGGIEVSPIAIPNSDKFIFSDTTGRWRVIENANSLIASQPFDHQVRHSISGVDTANIIKDQAGNNLEVRLPVFSPGGRWMVAESRTYGMYRMDLNNYETIFFEKPFDYNIGLEPNQQLAISNDGRYVILASDRQIKFKLFDMSTCVKKPVPNAVENCQQRDLLPFIQDKVPGFLSVRAIRFSDQYTLTLFASYRDSAGNFKRAYTSITAPGYTPVYFNYLGLGDSFAAGEGAYEYRSGTDITDPFNKCHLSNISYPYLMAQYLGLNTYQSVACSGAKIKDINFADTNTYNREERQSKGLENALDAEIFDNFLVGYRIQLRFVEKYKPSVITVSMGGNDINFGGIVFRCIGIDTCYSSPEERWELAQKIHDQFDPLVKLYNQLQEQAAPSAKIYIVGYPSMVKEDGNCAANVHANANELKFFNDLVFYLNFVVKQAALKAGVSYVDVEDAFVGSRLCEGVTGGVAVNGLTAGNDKFLDIGPIGKESYHPNRIGHGLFRDKILERTNNFTLKNPEPNSAIPKPGLISAADFVGINLPPLTTRFIDDDGLIDGLIYHNGDYRIQNESFAPNSQVTGSIHSNPINIGTFTADENGVISEIITIPSHLTPGFHEIHLAGKNIADEEIDVQKLIYVASSESDYDGDGVLNVNEACTVVEPSGQDADRDGVDDGCDGFIGEAPQDTTAPAVNGQPDREPGAEGWYKDDVTIKWNVSDPEPSSGEPNTPPPTIAGQDGEHTYTSEPSCDAANNCTAGSVSLKIDKAAPEISFNVDPAPNTAGWNNSPVTITFHCSDSVSGVANCSEPITLNSDDGSYILSGHATDKAGNTADVNAVIMIDTAKPVIDAAISPTANAAGWHNTNVQLNIDCTDANAGIAYCSPGTTLSGEGFGQSIISSALDNAGNSTTTTNLINIDKSAPIIGTPTWSVNPKPSTDATTLSIPVSDNLSGVTEGEYFLGENDPGLGNGATMSLVDSALSTTFGADFPTGVYKVSVRAMDRAGNWSSIKSDYVVVYDSSGIRMVGKKTLKPSLGNGDVLPGLTSTTQTNLANFGFSVRYGSEGQIHKTSDFQFSYETGTNCKKPAEAQNCHYLKLNASSIEWLTTMGTNSSTGIFQGHGSIDINGSTQQVRFRITGVDGELLGTTNQDHLTLLIFPAGANPSTDQPSYRVSADVQRGSIRIRSM